MKYQESERKKCRKKKKKRKVEGKGEQKRFEVKGLRQVVMYVKG